MIVVQTGVSLLKVSKLLGHADVKMTEKYAHLCPDATGREAMDILDQIASINSTEGDDPEPNRRVIRGRGRIKTTAADPSDCVLIYHPPMDRITARRVDVEIAKLLTEAQKLGAETRKLNAEADKLIRERWWYPGLLLATTIGTTAAVVKLILS